MTAEGKNVTTTGRDTADRSVLTADGQPWGSAAYDSNSAEMNQAALSRHLSALEEMPSVQQAWDHAIRALRLELGNRALDVGCGSGVFLRVLGELVGDRGLVVGLDHAPSLLVEAQRLYGESGSPASAAFLVGDALSLPLRNGAFDAAHIERVLLHLTAPDRALRELARVVRPGGWVVAVEPDLAGWRIDHPDQEAIRALVRGFGNAWRHPAIGLELSRRMTTAGLVNVSTDVVSAVERALPNDVLVYYQQAFQTAIESDWISQERASRAIDELDRAAQTGAFTSYSSLFVVAGEVPHR